MSIQHPPQVEFSFGGHDVGAAEELIALLNQQFGEGAARVATHDSREEDQKSAEVVLAVIAVVLSLPGAINETMDLAERIRQKKKADAVIAWGKQRAERGQAVPKMLLPGGRAVALDKVKSDELLNTMSAKW